MNGGDKVPVEEVIPELKERLRSGNNVVLVAPPGAGKTTRVPLALLEESWAMGGRILMLEPRRLAARSAARYMAALLGEKAGQTIGYRVRMDTCVGPQTRVEVITEGILTRMLQSDPSLEGVAAVIFDEFHERSLHADLGLALALQAQGLLREDLRILVMSATLEAEAVAGLLGGAPVVRSEGRSYPVETRYVGKKAGLRLEEAVVPVVLEALRSNSGDVLVFLPGAGEIRRVESKLKDALGRQGTESHVRPLYGTLSQEAQDQALTPCAPGERKVVLATSIAETSLTVEGVRVVVDAGLARVPRFSPRTGMTRLETVPVSRASADQRRGRAGRQGPGTCYRLWTEQEERALPPRSTPEVLEADLAPLALELAAWGAAPEDLSWLDQPPAPALAQARELLQRLGALGADGAITRHGRAMARLGLHPRLAHMLLRSVPLGLGAQGCELAAVLGERDFLRAAEGGAAPVDLRLRLAALKQGASGVGAGLTVDPAALRRIKAEAEHWRCELGLGPAAAAAGNGQEACGLLLAFAYPDRIGQQRSAGKFTLRNGRGVQVPTGQPLAYAAYIVAAELDDQGADSRVYLGAPLELTTIETNLADQLEREDTITWDRSAQAVRARQRVKLGAITLQEKPLQNPDLALTAAALLQGVALEGLGILPWSKGSRQLLERLRFMHQANSDWPDVTDEALLATLEEWLGPHIHGIRSKAELSRLNMTEVLESLLDWNRKRELDQLAPTHLTVPSGSRVPVDYSDPAAPVLSARLQEIFGWTETPRIGGGRVPVVMHLLSPAQRPVQVTRDLANFWRETYFEVKKDLKGRYPKHYWPDNPLEATATNRVRPKPGN